MDLSLLERPLFHVAGHYISVLGLIAFVVLLATGMLIARTHFAKPISSAVFLAGSGSSKPDRDSHNDPELGRFRSFSRSPRSTLRGFRFLECADSRNQAQPVSGISAHRAFDRVFWISSQTKHFLFNQFLVNSGLDRVVAIRHRANRQ